MTNNTNKFYKENELHWRTLALQKPKLRGVTHVISFFISLYFGYILLSAAPEDKRFSILIYIFSVSGLFGVSGLLHYPDWPPHIRRILGQIDHSMIFILIAGSYTGILSVVPSSSGIVTLTVWLAAFFGITSKLVWFGSEIPKYIVSIPYIMSGWACLLELPNFYALVEDLSVFCTFLLALGGLFYTAGGIIYALRKPKLYPVYFGYHELFHVFVIIGAVLHYLVVYIKFFYPPHVVSSLHSNFV